MYQTNCIIALGSNTGNCIYHLKKAISELDKLGSIKKIASLYLSKPYGYINQNDFYNTAVVLKTAQQPMQLMKNIYKLTGCIDMAMIRLLQPIAVHGLIFTPQMAKLFMVTMVTAMKCKKTH